ncbi:MAG: hypothetical protein KDJ41_08960 [Hyphomicrobiaceae bacterium]|nr:hypothetical protein [Hyphomicrobiaceae bacterium]
MSVSQENPVREAVGVFDTPDALQNAIDELLSSGFNRAEISLLASEAAVVEKLGHRYRKAEELEDDVSVPRAAYVSTESVGDAEGAVIGGLMYVAAGILMGPVGAAGGSLAAIAMAGALGAGIGGLVGLPIAHYIGEQKTRRIEEQLAHGGLLLWVRVWNAERERCAVDILERNAGRDVHVHEFA